MEDGWHYKTQTNECEGTIFDPGLLAGSVPAGRVDGGHYQSAKWRTYV